MSDAQQHLFASLPQTASRWKAPAELPSLANVKWMALDMESTGKRKFKDKPVGAAYRLDDGRSGYLPWGHKGGGNLDEKQCKRWMNREVRGKDIVNLNTGFDAQVVLNWGVDLEAGGNRL